MTTILCRARRLENWVMMTMLRQGCLLDVTGLTILVAMTFQFREARTPGISENNN
jgi:hypothetical protein